MQHPGLCGCSGKNIANIPGDNSNSDSQEIEDTR